ncbi:MAG: hypothetical protein WCB15_15510 [Desulfobacterales bacterium]
MTDSRLQMAGDRGKKWEVGMRPPAHRGLRLRPGGKAEWGAGHRAKGMGSAAKGIGRRAWGMGLRASCKNECLLMVRG